MILAAVSICILFFVCLFVLDDLFIDLVAFVRGLGPKEITPSKLAEMQARPEKNIAIIIANWHEHEVIGRMVAGNVKNLKYKNYHFFLGVYPNDIETCVAAQNARAVFKNVHAIVNRKDGPTSKGQMLNEMTAQIVNYEKRLGIEFDIFLMHDSEDILHPLSLTMINCEIDRTDFLQIPVFSFDRPVKDFVGSIYIDEFAEIHTKDMLVREHLGAPVPSAGVGTAIQRRLMLTLMAENDGGYLREDSLTEDYVLGMSSAIKGFRTSFSCYFIRDKNNRREFIATREYFPNSYRAAVRQKTRWVLGIVLQGAKIVPWDGSLIHKYFLYRDRRGPANNFIAMCTTALTIYLLLASVVNGETAEFMSSWWFLCGSIIATTGMINRLFHRVRAVVIVNGWKRVWAVPLRWPVGNLINFMASAFAIKDYQRAVIKKQPLRWAKTTHELPAGFGDDVPQPTTALQPALGDLMVQPYVVATYVDDVTVPGGLPAAVENERVSGDTIHSRV